MIATSLGYLFFFLILPLLLLLRIPELQRELAIGLAWQTRANPSEMLHPLAAQGAAHMSQSGRPGRSSNSALVCPEAQPASRGPDIETLTVEY